MPRLFMRTGGLPKGRWKAGQSRRQRRRRQRSPALRNVGWETECSRPDGLCHGQARECTSAQRPPQMQLAAKSACSTKATRWRTGNRETPETGREAGPTFGRKRFLSRPLRRPDLCVIHESSRKTQLKPPASNAKLTANFRHTKDGMPWKLSIASSYVRL